MPTFKSKPVEPEVVDARKFTGTPDSAREISQWFKANYEGEYHSATLRERVTTSMIGSVEDRSVKPVNMFLLFASGGEYELFPECWLVHRQDGSWTTWSDDYMQRKYDQV